MHPAEISENRLRDRRQDHENETRLLEFLLRLPITPLQAAGRCDIKAHRLPVLSSGERQNYQANQVGRAVVELSIPACLYVTLRQPQENWRTLPGSIDGSDTLTSVNEQGVNDPQVDQDEGDRPKRLSGDKQEIGKGLDAHEDDAEPAGPGRPTR